MTETQKMQLTLHLAEKAMETGEFPIASVIFLEDEIIAESWTKETAERRLLVHAELNALIEADIKRYSFEDRRRMQLFTNLEPCMMCLGAAMSLFIGEVYYALESPSDGAVAMAQAWNPQSADFSAYRLPKIRGGILRMESIALFAQFAATCPPGGMREFALSLAIL